MNNIRQQIKQDEREYANCVAYRAAKWAIGALIVGFLLAFSVLPAYSMPGDDLDLQTFQAIREMDQAQKLTYIFILAMQDYRNTESYQMENRHRGNFEVNPVLGKHPSRRDLQVFGAVGLLSFYAVSKYLPEGKFKDILLDSVIASEQANVREDRDNYSHHKTGMPIMIVASFRF